MVLKSEKLLESLLDIEKARIREREIRIETEALLEGLQGLAKARQKGAFFKSLCSALGNVILFEDAFILEFVGKNTMAPLVSTNPLLEGSLWEPSSLFHRAIKGRPIAAFDISPIPEWKALPEELRPNIGSALHIGLHGGVWDAILIMTHSRKRHFGPGDMKKAVRFAPLASQAMLTLELHQKFVERDRFFQLSMDLMAIIDADGIIQQCNNVWTDLLGYERKEIRGKRLLDFAHPEDLEAVESVLHFIGMKEGKELLEVRFRKKNGACLWFSCSFAAYHNQRLSYIVARDITDSIKYRERLSHDARHDALTGLKNRKEFLYYLKTAFTTASRDKDYNFAVFFMDLNRFKDVNDTFGHDVGDELLTTFARILETVVRGRDLIARIGGDEFTLLLADPKSRSDVTGIAERIREKCLKPHDIKGHSIKISTSIGIALSASRYKDEEQMLNAADRAMYRAKLSPDNQYVVDD